MEHPVRDFHDQLEYRNAKSPASPEAGLAIEGVSDDQPRMRERIMKLSKYIRLIPRLVNGHLHPAGKVQMPLPF
jgi:hypothetical protein